MSVKDILLRRIEAFCRRHGITEATFGTKAVNDSRFIERLRDDMATMKLVRRAEDYMKNPPPISGRSAG